MFTGIVEAVGRVASVRASGDTRRIRIEVEPGMLDGVAPGASIAVDGACLTPVEVEVEAFSVDAVGTTLSRTVAGGYRPGTQVNLERAMKLGERLDGHLVQGHVDGMGRLVAVREADGFRFLVISIPEEVYRLTLLHGSITLNGVSLTVNRLLDDREIEVAIIPHTWERTNLRELTVGDPVNVEGDLIGKYVGKLLHTADPGSPTQPNPFLESESE